MESSGRVPRHCIAFVSLVILITSLGVKGGQQPSSFKTTCLKGGGCTKTPIDIPDVDDIELGRLPGNLLPYHYNIELQPDIYTEAPPFAFSGHVEVWFKCVEDTDVVYLNSLWLAIDESSIEIAVAEDSPVQPQPPDWTSVHTDDQLQFLILNLDAPLVTGAYYRLRIDFSGFLREPTHGFYWDSYEEDGETRYLAATQYQPHYARESLPCFDEPAMKATFNTTLVRQQDMVSLSNMEIISQEDRGEGWVADRYDVTPVMSTYILCFVVCDFVYVETISGNGHVIRIWAQRQNIHAADYALQTAANVQDYLEDYIGVPYTLPKLDHIALPSKSGAMENWGLITYREWSLEIGKGLLWDPDWSTTDHKRGVYSIIAHELAHMWFGNLVTCHWWDDMWLNEGFADFYRYRAMAGEAGWSSGEFQTWEGIHSKMNDDSLNTSVSLRMEVQSPWDPTSNTFTTQKGGAVVRMLRQILGEESFKRGINLYVTRHEYGTVTTDDLWQALNEQAAADGITDTDGSALDFKDKIDPWVDQPGFPLVSLHRNGQTTHAYQWRFLNPADQELNEPATWNYLYNVPLTYATSIDPDMGTDTKIWLDRENGTIEDIPQGADDWVVANIEVSGYYMVDYDLQNREALVEQLLIDHQIIPPETRAHLIHDAFRLARIHHHPEEYGFEMTRYLDRELAFAPWMTTIIQLQYPDLVLARYTATYGHFEVYIRGQVDWVYQQLGWQPDEEGGEEAIEVGSLRSRILTVACTYGNTDCIQESRDQYSDWKEDINNNPITSDHHLTVYCTVLTDGDQVQDDWDFAYQAYQLAVQSDHPYAFMEKEFLLTSMACPRDEGIIERYLQMILDGAIEPEDTTFAMTGIAQAKNGGRDVMWRHLVANWRELDVVPEGVSKYEIFLTTTDGFATDDDMAELDSFIAMYPSENEEEQLAYESAFSRVTENIDWADENQENLDEWLQEHSSLRNSQVETRMVVHM